MTSTFLDNNSIALDMQELANLYQLQAILNAMLDNLILISEGASGEKIVVSNANLYQLAAKYYNDPLQWTTIAQANGLDDPVVTGGQLINVIVNNGGSNYSNNPTITFVGNQSVVANASAIVVSGVIVKINIVTPGDFLQQPQIVITDTTGSGAIATAICAQSLVIPQTTTSQNGILNIDS